MKQRDIINAAGKRFKKINKVFRSVRLPAGWNAKDSMKTIHAFRVEVKKVRAFLRMAGEGGRDRLKIPEEIHQYYLTVGRIRSLLLQERRIREVLVPAKEAVSAQEEESGNIYFDILAREVEGYKILARAGAKSKCISGKKEKKWTAWLCSHARKSSAKRFAARKVRQMKELLAQSNWPAGDSRRLHEIRKILKDLLYTWSFTGPYVLRELAAHAPLTHGDLESLTSRLGDHQDDVIAIELLQPLYTNRVSYEKERVFLLDLRSRWAEERERKERGLFAQLEKIFDKNVRFSVSKPDDSAFCD